MQELQRASEEGILTSVVVEADTPRGWIAAEPQGHGSWEIHPLLVDPTASGRGYGRILVEDIERKMRSHGGIAAFLSTSDATHSTNLSDVDLYKDPLEALRNIGVRDHTHGHAYQFWQRVGFTIVGVIPDAEGFGVPSIHMAKRLQHFAFAYKLNSRLWPTADRQHPFNRKYTNVRSKHFADRR